MGCADTTIHTTAFFALTELAVHRQKKCSALRRNLPVRDCSELARSAPHSNPDMRVPVEEMAGFTAQKQQCVSVCGEGPSPAHLDMKQETLGAADRQKASCTGL